LALAEATSKQKKNTKAQIGVDLFWENRVKLFFTEANFISFGIMIGMPAYPVTGHWFFSDEYTSG